MRFSRKNSIFFVQVFQDGALRSRLWGDCHTDSILLRKIWGESYTVS